MILECILNSSREALLIIHFQEGSSRNFEQARTCQRRGEKHSTIVLILHIVYCILRHLHISCSHLNYFIDVLLCFQNILSPLPCAWQKILWIIKATMNRNTTYCENCILLHSLSSYLAFRIEHSCLIRNFYTLFPVQKNNSWNHSLHTSYCIACIILNFLVSMLSSFPFVRMAKEGFSSWPLLPVCCTYSSSVRPSKQFFWYLDSLYLSQIHLLLTIGECHQSLEKTKKYLVLLFFDQPHQWTYLLSYSM